MEVQQVLYMNGGDNETSYAKNSAHERLILLKVKSALENCIEEIFRTTLPECAKVADLGCSSGPNTFESILEIIRGIDRACQKENHQQPVTIQVFLNDLFGNDFNAVFKSLPSFYEKLDKLNGRKQGSCLIAAMPGSFYGRLFPKSSMHFMHASYSLHWLSQVPNGLVAESGIHLNKGSIYIEKTSPPMVQQAYLDQFTKDMTTFLRNRNEELVPHGQLLLTIVGKNDDESDGPHVMNILGNVLNDMVIEGYVEEEKLASFNIPQYAASIEEVRSIILEEGSFKILHLQAFKLPLDASLPYDPNEGGVKDDHDIRAAYVATFIRAVFEPILETQFGHAIMTDLFERFATKTAKLLEMGKGVVNTVVVSIAKKCEN